MLRVTGNLSAATSPVATLSNALRLSLLPSLSFASPSFLRRFSSSSSPFLRKPISFLRPRIPSSFSSRVSKISHPKSMASYSSESGRGTSGREVMVQHLLVKGDDLELLTEIQQRILAGEDMGDLAAEYSICPSKKEGGMLGWVRVGQMVPEFEEAAFETPLNQVVRCKTQFGWHLLQVLSEREGLKEVGVEELHSKMQDPAFMDEAQLIDVREPDEIAIASLPGFKAFPLRQFGNWAPDITSKLDPHKDTYVMCKGGMRSMQVANWLQSQGFKRVYNVAGGINAYSLRVDQSVPTY
ncbi:PREDICTED: rhodanese-like/PpiC domain-containing protein 12, chloroplastic isoform X2 [Tarenaya hassleriana]|uniref:rhodanese-like/PpiC domain-containing protein 12, chloroplastic isoform X2 n=1 Tax=Tarenaya hassleriana TaxID=28532 RepID=UPI00053C2382|nr:PREDICTED: rhodanese-like/PpiC domain-containing protein 12, chloroplastic isoform X2 [Tarenaya hassleriana]